MIDGATASESFSQSGGVAPRCQTRLTRAGDEVAR
jgi:hypothetical protein